MKIKFDQESPEISSMSKYEKRNIIMSEIK
jgi:hypothetical protein